MELFLSNVPANWNLGSFCAPVNALFDQNDSTSTQQIPQSQANSGLPT